MYAMSVCLFVCLSKVRVDTEIEQNGTTTIELVCGERLLQEFFIRVFHDIAEFC